jgi:hypothetical protein
MAAQAGLILDPWQAFAGRRVARMASRFAVPALASLSACLGPRYAVRSSLRPRSHPPGGGCAFNSPQESTRPLQFTVVLRIPDHECVVAEADQSGRITSAGGRSPEGNRR